MNHVRLWLALLLLVFAVPGHGDTPSQKGQFDILIVIDSRKPEHVKAEHDLRTALEKSRALHALDSRDLPVDTYDVANAGQKAAVDRLKIPDWQLPFLGLSQLASKDNVPERVVFGGGPVDKMEQSVGATMEEAFKRLGLKIKPPPASPQPSITGPSFMVMVVQGNVNQGILIERLQKAAISARDARGLTKEQLPVLVYHEVRAGALLRSLGIDVPDTPVLCVAAVENRKPTKVLYRLANVKDPVPAAKDVVAHGAQLLQH